MMACNVKGVAPSEGPTEKYHLNQFSVFFSFGFSACNFTLFTLINIISSRSKQLFSVKML